MQHRGLFGMHCGTQRTRKEKTQLSIPTEENTYGFLDWNDWWNIKVFQQIFSTSNISVVHPVTCYDAVLSSIILFKIVTSFKKKKKPNISYRYLFFVFLSFYSVVFEEIFFFFLSLEYVLCLGLHNLKCGPSIIPVPLKLLNPLCLVNSFAIIAVLWFIIFRMR